MPDAHCQTALQLAGYEFRHDHLATVDQTVVAHDFYLAREGVDVEFDDAGSGRIGRHTGIIALNGRIVHAASLDEVIAAGGHTPLEFRRGTIAVTHRKDVRRYADRADRRNIECRRRPFPAAETVQGNSCHKTHLMGFPGNPFE